MSSEEEDRLLFPCFAIPESFAEAATPGSGGKQKKARQRRRRKPRGDEQASKQRRLSDEQARLLELSFRKDHKLETPRKVQLAAELDLDANQVAVWFQNRRARHKIKVMQEEFSKLRAAHDAVVLQNCHLETELLKMKERLAEAEEEKRKLIAAGAVAGGAGAAGSSSPSSLPLSTVTHHPAALVGQFGVEPEEAPDLTYMSDFAYNNSYMSEYAYNNYMMEMMADGYLAGVVYDDNSYMMADGYLAGVVYDDNSYMMADGYDLAGVVYDDNSYMMDEGFLGGVV